MGNQGGSVPTGWSTPEGWLFLGANFLLQGSGPTLSALAVGGWAKLATSAEPADYMIHITFGAGSKRIHAAIVAVQDADLVDGGAHIRMAGHPIRRLLRFNELLAPSATLCDFMNIPAGYDNLELVWDAGSDQNGDTANRRIKLNYNASVATNYYYRIVQDGVDAGQGVSTTRLLLGAINGTASGPRTAGSVHILGYSRPSGQQVSLGNGWWVASGPTTTHIEQFMGQWDGVAAINRIGVATDAGTVRFNTGSRAYLYGY
jgi:hypothetical protein